MRSIRGSLAAVAVLCCWPAAARADSALTGYHPFGPSPPGWAIRANASETVTDVHSVGVDLSRAWDWWGVALEVGHAWLSDRTTALDVTALARIGAMGPRHSVTLGLGPRLLFAQKSYGTVLAAQTELAYEYRPFGGLSVLVGAGPVVVLNDSDPGSCGRALLENILCRESFRVGDANLRFRLALGVSF